MEWSTVCADWEQRIVQGRSLIPLPPLFPAEADAADAVFRALRIVDVAGQPTFGEAGREWIFDFVRAVFGAYDPDTGRRLISEFMLLISKKNGKSTLAAAIMLTAIIRNWRHSAEFLILSPTIEVAKNSFGPAADMVRADPELSELLHVQDHVRTITHRTMGTTLKVVAADSETVSGKKATGVLVDELWLFGKKPNADKMLVEATGGIAARPEGFVIYLTTHSDEAPAGVFKSKLALFRDARDGIAPDPTKLGALYEYPAAMLKAEAYKEAANWHVTNPNMGASVDQAFLARKFEEAKREGEGQLRVFLAKHLNVEIGLNLRSDRWAGADWWEKRADPALRDLDELLARCEVVTLGIDGGGLDDLLGLAVLGRETGGRRWFLWNRAWCHEGVLETRKSEASKLRDFERDGDLTIVADMAEANEQLAQVAVQVEESGLLAEVGVDMYGTTDQADALAKAGIEKVDRNGKPRIVGVQQGYRLNGIIKTMETRLASGTLIHAGQPLMAWCVGNAKTVQQGNAISITKQAAGTAKIDPLVAAFCAGIPMVQDPKPRGRSVYEERGLTVL